jgi:hypothetical protein
MQARAVTWALRRLLKTMRVRDRMIDRMIERGAYGMRARVTISIGEQRLDELDAFCRSQGTTRSAAVEKALDLWAHHRRNEALAAGYRDMATENIHVAEEQLAAFSENEDHR